MDRGKNRLLPSIFWSMLLVIFLVEIFTVTIFTLIRIKYQTSNFLASADAKLLIAAECAREVVGPEYHDRIVDETSVTKAEFDRIVARNDDLCRRFNLQYLWSVLLVEDRLVFTSASHSGPHRPDSPCAVFFETHHDPMAFAPALQSEFTPSFSSFTNEWGRGRMVLFPRKDARGRTYIFGASVQLAELNAMIRRTIAISVGVGMSVFVGVFLVSTLFARTLSAPITQLTVSASRMARGDLDVPPVVTQNRELQLLADSLDVMQRELKLRMALLRESEENAQSLFENMLNGLAYCKMIYDQGKPQDFIYLTVNQSFVTNTGLQNVTGKKSSEVIPGLRETDPELFEIYGRVASTGRPEVFERYVIALRMWFHVSAYSPRKDHFVAMFDVITERKRAEMALLRSREDIRLLAKRISEIDEAERTRLSRDLHDRVGQSVTSLGIFLAHIADDLSPHAPMDVKFRAGTACLHAEALMGEVRNVMMELRPAVLDDYGLIAAVRSYGKDFAQRNGISVVIDEVDTLGRLPLDVETAVFRIFQEALSNALRHAKAAEACIICEMNPSGWRIVFGDNGIGFDVVAAQARRASWGLAIMQERARAVGCELLIRSRPGQGTSVIVDIPAAAGTRS